MSDATKFNPCEHLINLKGKEYLEVKWRILWFREACPKWAMRTELVSHSEAQKSAVFRAEVRDEGERVIATGYGSESAADFKDYLEKAETKAVGRALGMLGFGTQFAAEMDDGGLVVDAPVPPPASKDFSAQKRRMQDAAKALERAMGGEWGSVRDGWAARYEQACRTRDEAAAESFCRDAVIEAERMAAAQ